MGRTPVTGDRGTVAPSGVEGPNSYCERCDERVQNSERISGRKEPGREFPKEAQEATGSVEWKD